MCRAPSCASGNFSGGRVFLQTGQRFQLDLNPTPGSASRVNLPHPEIIEAASIGCSLLLDDGKLRLRVVRKRGDALETEVVVGGPLSDHKGVNVPDVVLPIPALTEKDRDDLAFALEHGANYIGLSFVQRPEDVAEAKELIRGRAWVMVKLEKPQALENLDAIMQLTDAVMVARGDLGVELPPEEVPLAQKRIVRLRASVGQARRGGDADAGEHDQRAGADARRGLRRRDGGVRRRGCGDAVGGDRGRPVSLRGGQHDGPHRRARGAGSRLARDDRGEPAGAGARHRRRDRRRGATGVPHDRGEGGRGLSPLRARPRCVSRANGRRRRSSA